MTDTVQSCPVCGEKQVDIICPTCGWDSTPVIGRKEDIEPQLELKLSEARLLWADKLFRKKVRGQLREIVKHVAALNLRVDELEKQKELKKQVASLNLRIDELERQSELVEYLTSLTLRVEELEKKNSFLEEILPKQHKTTLSFSSFPSLSTFTDNLGTEFILIPSGSFMMGLDLKEKASNINEDLGHRVNISNPFYLGKYLVTQQLWIGIMGNNPGFFVDFKNPVENVSLDEVVKFLRVLNLRDSLYSYRLPTPAEWEYASRANTISTFFFGNDKDMLHSYAWFNENSKKMTHPVGQKDPNPWGLYDMCGNVWEWVLDCDRSFYEDCLKNGIRYDDGPFQASYQEVRGGSYLSDAISLRSSSHGFRQWDSEANDIGFRLVLEIKG
jgi:formylglycine-generating enzyme required for sulfatase activity